MIELRHLRLIQAVAATGSMTAAARHLHLTQSALSHQLRELEERLGVALVDRSARPLRLTQAGRVLEETATQVLAQVEAAEERIQAIAQGRAGRLTLAAECHSCLDWLIPKLHAVRRRFPDVSIDLALWARFDALPALVAGDVDLVLTPDAREAPGVAWEALFRFEMRLVVAADHPLARRPWVAPQEVAGETLLVYPVERSRLDVFTRFLWPASLEPRRVRTVDSTALLVELAALGQGVAVLPQWACQSACREGRISTVSLGDDGLLSSLWAAVREADRHATYLRCALTLLQDGPCCDG